MNSPFVNDPRWEGIAVHLQFGAETFIALGASDRFVSWYGDPDPLGAFDRWIRSETEWAFGIIGYDLRLYVEKFSKHESPNDRFPLLVWIRPLVLIRVDDSAMEVIVNMTEIPASQLINSIAANDRFTTLVKHVVMTPVVSRERYIRDVDSLQRHIQLGDIYEVNYCMPFEAICRGLDPYDIWKSLYAQTDAPMSGYFRFHDLHLMCASPERFLQRNGNVVRSQPIKGTIQRGGSAHEDEVLKETLRNSGKERSENVMIVDLVRNDLSRSAIPGSVVVEELFSIHTFKTLHHMISTIRSEVDHTVGFVDLIRDTFPMGSMTGAPKIESMKLIDSHEAAPRGWYSGALGYIKPDGDFDLNVIIRSLIYDSDSGKLSCSVGSAITSQAKPANEYDECLLKLSALRKVLEREPNPAHQ